MGVNAGVTWSPAKAVIAAISCKKCTQQKVCTQCAHCDHFEQMCAIDDQLANLLDLTLATSLPA